MHLRPDQLTQHLDKSGGRLRPVYVIHGDDPLLTQEAGDVLRQAARAAGHTDRQVHTVSGAHFDWSAVLASARAQHPLVQAGEFGADMQVRLLNDGPVTIPLNISG